VTEPAEFPASWYDGHSALRHEGLLCWQGGGQLVLRHPQGEGVAFGAEELIFREDRPGERVYTLDGTPQFRLILKGKAPRQIEALLPVPARYGKWVDRIGLPQAAAAFAIVSAAVVAVVLTAPGWLGPMIPESWERRMGEAMIGDFGNRICHTQAGDAALARLADELDPGGETIRVGVANIEMVNAVALPGGQVLLFDGLVQDAESPEELAGVLAHEIGHVRERHVMSALLRQFGISILASGVGSGLGEGALGIMSLGYSREAEAEADVFARAQMARAEVSPAGAAEFFERLRGPADGGTEEPGWTGWIQTHPSPVNRAKAFRDAVEQGEDYPPALSAEEFAAIRAMCEEDGDVEEFDFF
jgi:Zn-dependent protease with chaperone function